MKIKLLFLLFIYSFHAQSQNYISGKLVNSSHQPIPFVNIYDKSGRGIVSNEAGEFKFNNLKDSITFSAVGFIPKKLALADLQRNSTVILENTPYQLKDFIVSNKTSIWLGHTPQKRKVHSYLLNSSLGRAESGIQILNKNNINGTLKTIKVHVANEGNSSTPLRINIYELNEQGFPKESILKKDMVFTPKNKKLKPFKFDILDQQIDFPENGICVSIEFLNINNDKSIRPFYLAFYTDVYKSIANHGFGNNWYNANFPPPAISVEILK